MTKLKPYTKYKDSGVEWLGKIPEGWDILRNLALFLERNERVENRDFELLSVTIGKGVIKQSDVESKKDSSNQDKSKYKITKENDIVYNKMRMWQGAVGHNKYLGMVSPAYIVLKPNRKINPRYYHYLFRTKAHNSESYKEGYGIVDDQHSLRFYQFKSMYSPYPDIQTQNDIVYYLDNKSAQIDSYVKKLKKEILLLKEHRQKIISQAVTCGLDENGKLRKKPEWKEGDPIPKGWRDSGVEWLGLIPEGWEVRKLGYLGHFKKGKGISKDNLTSEGKPVILYGDIYTKYEVKTEKLLRKAPDAIVTNAERITKNDILFTGSGETKEEIGKCVVYLGDEYGYAGGDTIIFSPKPMINTVFLSYLMYSSQYVSVKASLAKGQIIVHIYSSGLKNIPVVLPSRQDQQEICKYLDQVSLDIKKQIRKITEQIEFIKEYKQSLISKVVTGKIDVRNTNNNLSED